MTHGFQCLFCAGSIAPTDLDPCALNLVARFDRSRHFHKEQTFFCHHACLVRRASIDKSLFMLPDLGTVGEIVDEEASENGVLSDPELGAIETRCSSASAPPWRSFIEGRDHSSGSSFIRTGGPADSSVDIELAGAAAADQDFIAHARQDIPALLASVRKLKAMLVG